MEERAVFKACYRLVSTGDTFDGDQRYISLSFLRHIIVHLEMLIQTRVNKFVGLFSLLPLARNLHVHRLLPRQLVTMLPIKKSELWPCTSFPLLLVRAISTFTCYYSGQEN